MRELLKGEIRRGHIEIRVSLNRRQGEAAGCNSQLLRQYVRLFQQVSKEVGLEAKADLNVLFALPGVLDGTRPADPLSEEFGTELQAALAACIGELNAYREREGRELWQALEAETAALEQQAAQIAAIRSEASAHFHNRLRERLLNLLRDSGISEARLVEEAALLADKSDVQE
jgi:uncharacterized protein (TIGR00255 family)